MDISENEGYKNMILGFLENIKGNVLTWSSKQAYIALGFGLFAASLEKVDATPMEGFLPDQVDAILGLSEKGLHSVCLLALGERDSESDYLSKMKKVRQSKESMFTFL
jgi:nitroreductase